MKRPDPRDIDAYREYALTEEGKTRSWVGVHTVLVLFNECACDICKEFSCKILIDDVYSDGTKEEGYPLSEAIRGGFLHPGCRCKVVTYDAELYKAFPNEDPLKKQLEYKRKWESKR